MLMPSETEMVANSRGVPPASAIPSFAASTWKSWVMLQGVCSPFMLTTPTMGFASAVSSSPIARMKARCGARSRPSVVTRDRHFFIDIVPQAAPNQAETAPLSALLQRSDNSRMLELSDVKLRKHSGFGVDIEHLLDRREVRRSTGVAAEIVALQEVRVEHRDRRLQHFRNNF